MNLKPLDRSDIHTPQYPERILQFGGGNFLRGFVDWMVDILNESSDFQGSVVMVKPTEKGDYHQLREQQGLFHVILKGQKKGVYHQQVDLISCVSRIIQVYDQWDEFIKTAEIASIRFVVSNTTEAGIAFSSSDTKEMRPPQEFPAKLTLWLYHRFKTFQGAEDKGCILLPCELVVGNGTLLKHCILKYAAHWGLDQEFQDWINNHNQFCNTLVDRIVSGYPGDQAEKIQSDLGYKDSQLVSGELYHSWVIEGSSELKDELPFHKTSLNVQFVDDVTIYHDLKVRVLNGAHTALVPVAYLCGYKTVHQSFSDPYITQHIESLLSEEVTPTLDLRFEQVQSFIGDVLERFRNPSLQHELLSIALNSTSKFATRLLPTLKDYFHLKEHLPARIILSLAALLKFYQGRWNGSQIPLKDNRETLLVFQQQWEAFQDKTISPDQLVLTLLSNTSIWGEDLSKIKGLVTAVTNCLKLIDQQGVSEVVKHFDKANIKSIETNDRTD